MQNQTTPTSLKVLITAGASGMGLVTAQEVLKSGAKVYICYVSENALKSAIADNPGLQGCVADVSVEAQVKNFKVDIDNTGSWLAESELGDTNGFSQNNVTVVIEQSSLLKIMQAHHHWNNGAGV
jgi:NAD(P)-dependent dehydrogenase (short-subunit alcohol dehydrogenase family)